MVKKMDENVRCRGNILMNIGKKKDGIIQKIYEERIRGMGEWIKINGEEIYYKKKWYNKNENLNDGVW
jgi:alpha-L-fucosidase